MTIVEELAKIIRLQQQRGGRTVELSEVNRRALCKETPPRKIIRNAPQPQPSVVTPPPDVRTTLGDGPREQLGNGAGTVVSPTPTRPHFVLRSTSQEPTTLGGVRPTGPDLSAAGWEELHDTCMRCIGCALAPLRNHVVFEDGCRTAPLMFIGEGPGADEDAQGVPFVGRAGQLLTAMIHAMKRDRASTDPATAVYIANIVKCRPPDNRNPQLDEVAPCIGYLHRQIALVRPKAIVLLGNVPLKALTGLDGIIRRRGKWVSVDGIPAMPTYHPAYLLRQEKTPKDFIAKKWLVWQDLQQVMALLSE